MEPNKTGTCGSCEWGTEDKRGWKLICGNLGSEEFGDPVMPEYTCGKWEQIWRNEDERRNDRTVYERGRDCTHGPEGIMNENTNP